MIDDESPPQWFTDLEQRRAALKVADRVRIDVGECPHFLSWHGYIEQGVLGVIVTTEPADSPRRPPGHRYLVMFDRPIRARRFWDYAAHELTPVTHEEILAEILKEDRSAR